jgi:hypothetical protein
VRLKGQIRERAGHRCGLRHADLQTSVSVDADAEDAQEWPRGRMFMRASFSDSSRARRVARSAERPLQKPYVNIGTGCASASGIRATVIVRLTAGSMPSVQAYSPDTSCMHVMHHFSSSPAERGASRHDSNRRSSAFLGRWRFRPGAKTRISSRRRACCARATLGGVDHPVVITPNGLRAGEYTAPIFDYKFAEAAPPGNQPPPPNIFETFMFLAQGEGPYNGGPVVGQLSPWPNLVVPPAPLGCAAAPLPPPPPPPGGLPPLVATGDLLTRTGPTVSFSAATLLANDIGSGITMRRVSPLSAAGGAITGTGPWIYNAPTAVRD